MDTYRSARTLATVAMILVAMQGLFYAGFGIACAATMVDIEDAKWLVPFSTLAAPTVLAYVAALVVFMMWVHRSVSNLTVLGSENLMAPAAAVWSFFIPFVNIVRPHTVMATIWKESQPTVINEHGYAMPTSTKLVTAWWVSIFVATISSYALRFESTPTTMSELHTLLVISLVNATLWLVACGAFMYLVQRSQQRQDAQWHDLELRRAAPQPDASILR